MAPAESVVSVQVCCIGVRTRGARDGRGGPADITAARPFLRGLGHFDRPARRKGGRCQRGCPRTARADLAHHFVNALRIAIGRMIKRRGPSAPATVSRRSPKLHDMGSLCFTPALIGACEPAGEAVLNLTLPVAPFVRRAWGGAPSVRPRNRIRLQLSNAAGARRFRQIFMRSWRARLRSWLFVSIM